MSDSSYVTPSLDTTHIGVRSVEQTSQASCSRINSAGATVSVYSSVRIGIVVEPDGFSLSTCQDGAMRRGYLGVYRVNSNRFFFSEERETGEELFEGYSACCFVFDLTECEVYVCGRQLFVN